MHYWMEKKYSLRKYLHEFARKEWTHSGLNQLLQKIDSTGSADYTERNCQPKSGRNEKKYCNCKWADM